MYVMIMISTAWLNRLDILQSAAILPRDVARLAWTAIPNNTLPARSLKLSLAFLRRMLASREGKTDSPSSRSRLPRFV